MFTHSCSGQPFENDTDAALYGMPSRKLVLEYMEWISEYTEWTFEYIEGTEGTLEYMEWNFQYIE